MKRTSLNVEQRVPIYRPSTMSKQQFKTAAMAAMALRDIQVSACVYVHCGTILQCVVLGKLMVDHFPAVNTQTPHVLMMMR